MQEEWEHRVNNTRRGEAIPLQNGGYVMPWVVSDDLDSGPVKLYAFDEDLESKWVYDLPNYAEADHIPTNIRSLAPCANGDFLYLGRVLHYFDNTGFGYTIGRISKEGELKWARFYRLLDYPDFRIDYLQETSDHGILAYNTRREVVGSTQYSNPYLLKLDSMGCFTPGCTQEVLYFENDTLVDFQTSIKEITKENIFFSIAPNPTNNFTKITWQQALPQSNSQLKIFSTEGKLVQEIKLSQNEIEQELDLSAFPKGLYLLALEIDGQVVQREKIIKL